MIKSLLKLAFILVLGILIYNYFLGTDSEKEGAKKVFTEVKDIGVAVKDLLSSEKEKFDKGKYDNALNKIGDMLQGLKQNAEKIDKNYLDRIRELDKMKDDLKSSLSAYSDDNEGADKFAPGVGGKDSVALKSDLRNLLKQTEDLIREMEGGGR